jgi:AcrR family transcriptional regulator
MNDEQKILKHATEEFLEKGFFKTSMDQLASGMKISKKTIYKFYPSKTSLLEKVVSTFQESVKSKLHVIMENDKCTTEKIKDLGEFFAHFSLKINKKILSDFLLYKPEMWEKIDQFRTEIISEFWEKLIIEGKKEGLIIDKSNKIILGVILSSIRGIINPKFLSENNISITEAFDETFSIVINGILTEKGKIEFEKQEWI